MNKQSALDNVRSTVDAVAIHLAIVTADGRVDAAELAGLLEDSEDLKQQGDVLEETCINIAGAIQLLHVGYPRFPNRHLRRRIREHLSIHRGRPVRRSACGEG